MSGLPPTGLEFGAYEPGRADRYTGSVLLARLLQATDDSVRVYEVRFSAGARTVWHAHEGAQVLVGISGVCVVQMGNETPQRLGPGMMLRVPAGIRHWHGANPLRPASHLALNVHGKTTWNGPVSATEYLRATTESG